jgi:hypothetical protein
MPSPFPGMNPYLEQESVWQDFHQTFIPLLRELLKSIFSKRCIERMTQPATGESFIKARRNHRSAPRTPPGWGNSFPHRRAVCTSTRIS